MRNMCRDILLITISAFVYGVGISLFLDPNHLAPGGVTGISIILSHMFGGNSGTWYLLLNIPILFLGLWKFGIRFIARTCYAVAASSFFIHFLTSYGPLTTDRFLAAVVGAFCVAAAIGLCFRAHATTGGIDILVKVLRLRFRYLKTGFIFQCFDFTVVSMSAIVFRDVEIALYALLAVFITGKALDYILYGSDEAKMIFIITEHPHPIGQRLLHEVDVGYTLLRGWGGYSGQDKEVILCCAPKKAGPAIQEVVKSEDPSAFMIFSSASEIYGQGYKDYFSEQL